MNAYFLPSQEMYTGALAHLLDITMEFLAENRENNRFSRYLRDNNVISILSSLWKNEYFLPQKINNVAIAQISVATPVLKSASERWGRCRALIFIYLTFMLHDWFAQFQTILYLIRDQGHVTRYFF